MKNACRKRLVVVLLDAGGNPEPHSREVIREGKAGFKVAGVARVLWWVDEGRTWKRVEK